MNKNWQTFLGRASVLLNPAQYKEVERLLGDYVIFTCKENDIVYGTAIDHEDKILRQFRVKWEPTANGGFGGQVVTVLETLYINDLMEFTNNPKEFLPNNW